MGRSAVVAVVAMGRVSPPSPVARSKRVHQSLKDLPPPVSKGVEQIDVACRRGEWRRGKKHRISVDRRR
ncbi:unnamed protein product [Arabis nemorensis]|uniref:Uncharacterized protein n=1 Tax=Arabis nemorensis TaxID=586526 RepID=A0A565AS51_9BRAS|nr:unnamed protein product [Arabis nemorensis]